MMIISHEAQIRISDRRVMIAGTAYNALISSGGKTKYVLDMLYNGK